MKVAIIGSGIAGIMAARTCHQAGVDLTLYEKAPEVGGHVLTDFKQFEGKSFPFEIGVFMFDPASIHPEVYSLAQELGMTLKELNLSVTHESKAEEIFWTTESPLPPSFRNFSVLLSVLKNGNPLRNLKFIYDIYRFQKQSGRISLQHPLRHAEMKKLQATGEFGEDLFNHWLFPHLLCWWGVPEDKAPECSIDVITDSIYRVSTHPQYIFKEGAQTFVNRIISPFKDCLKTGMRVDNVRKTEDGIEIDVEGKKEQYDHVIFAIPPSEVLTLLESPDKDEVELLSQFETVTTDIYFHTDTSWLPQKKKWALINFIQDERGKFITFWHGKLQNDHVPYFITWGDQLKEIPDPKKTLKVARMLRTLPTMGYRDNTCKFESIQGRGNIWHCGAHVDSIVTTNHMPIPSVWHENAFLSGVNIGKRIINLTKQELPCPATTTT